jgi:hypothetical protein
MLSKINRALTVAMMLVLFIGVAGALQETQPGSLKQMQTMPPAHVLAARASILA